jgi:8-oxo-dGTP diphosphatase
MAHPRVAAGALFCDDAGRVLLVKPTYKEGWDLPGGYVEPGETPTEACVREIKEELGSAVRSDPCLSSTGHPHRTKVTRCCSSSTAGP